MPLEALGATGTGTEVGGTPEPIELADSMNESQRLRISDLKLLFVGFGVVII